MKTMFTLYLLVISVAGGLARENFRCPSVCECDAQNLRVNCTGRGLKQVPNGIPMDTLRLDLSNNSISKIQKDDLSHLLRLQLLYLHYNDLIHIDEKAFSNLIKLEKLKLQRNKLLRLSAELFKNNVALTRLDISHNELQIIENGIFDKNTELRQLRLDHNSLRCIQDNVFSKLTNIEILSLKGNNLTTLGESNYLHMQSLKRLNLLENNLQCDCHLKWIHKWSKYHLTADLEVYCAGPEQHENKKVTEVVEVDFVCSSSTMKSNWNLVVGVASNYSVRRESPGYDSAKCRLRICPAACVCESNSIDCRGKRLTEVPLNIPDDAVEILMQSNLITELNNDIFRNLRFLRRIDFSNNNINYIAPHAFRGVSELMSLHLYSNKLVTLDENVFANLTKLKLLLLNDNKLTCLQTNLFKDLTSLSLLSIYRNDIQSISEGTFRNLKSITTLHMAKNPYICDCNMAWLTGFLKGFLDKSQSVCAYPKNVKDMVLQKLKSEDFKCEGSEKERTKLAGSCFIDKPCPKFCSCNGTAVVCSGASLVTVPSKIPKFTTELDLSNNSLSNLKADDSFANLTNLLTLKLSHNNLEAIEDGAFFGLRNLKHLDISHNNIEMLSMEMFQEFSESIETIVATDNKIRCLDNTSFGSMPRVSKITIYLNRLTTIEEGTIDKMPNLSFFEVMKNPLNCNCQMRWFPKFIDSKGITAGIPLCDQPTVLYNQPLTYMVDKHFETLNCSAFNKPKSCTISFCPKGCKCSLHKVNCKNAKLKQIPVDLPSNIRTLKLIGNSITKVRPSQLLKLGKLETLDLSDNFLTVITDGNFEGLRNLKNLLLNSNQIRCVTPLAFKGLVSLKFLSLHSNSIAMIPASSFKDLTSLSTLILSDNPLHCDNNLRWLAKYITSSSSPIEGGAAKCSTPSHMSNKKILYQKPDNFIGDAEPAILSKCNPCILKPCHNNASCSVDDQKIFSCKCTPGFTDRHCNVPIDICQQKPCYNNGQCISHNNERISCECMSGFYGERCERRIDGCYENKCKNNAACLALGKKYECECKNGYSGKFCEVDIDLCSNANNPCMNSAKCIDKGTEVECQCMKGFGGKKCDKDINECLSDPCNNNGKCINEIGFYKCSCLNGYTGEHCENPPMIYSSKSLCHNNQCKNGALCYANAEDYECICQPGYIGKHCEIVSVIQMISNISFLNIKDIPNDSFNLTFWFKPSNLSGILMYASTFDMDHHLSLELVNEKVVLSYAVAVKASIKIESTRLKENVTHQATITMESNVLEFSIDDIAQGKRNINETNTGKSIMQIYFGGLPNNLAKNAVNKFQLTSIHGYVGCVGNFYVNTELHQLNPTHDNSNGVRVGCPLLREKPVEVCNYSMCENDAKCEPTGNTYRCNCVGQFRGPMCSLVMKCIAPSERKKITSSGCTSKRYIRQTTCPSVCGDQCCKPKTREIRIKFLCPNGNSMVKKVTVIKKCQCTSSFCPS